LERMAKHTAPVLLLGESGTGKELAARGLHTEGSRRSGPFVAINCGAISEKLLESELFGHEKGAFTDAKTRKDGAFHRADHGTLFLDEIGEMPLAAQTKLLRTLETGEVCRVGGSGPSYPDVRVVAATNRDLEEEVRAGRFREDLFFRLAVLGLRIPPLRERKEDFPSLVRVLCEKLGPNIKVSEEALFVLEGHTFPGNVRELRNVLTRAFVLGGPQIDASTIRFSPWATPPGTLDHSADVLHSTERSILREAFQRFDGNRSAMARELGVPRTTLHYKLRRFGIAN
jgi:DNA-binding NtrC family response regulator